MSIRKSENYNNRNKYTEQDVAEMRQAEAEQQSAEDEYLAASKVKSAERKAIVISGLVSKYGFSQAGAVQVMSLIEKGVNTYGESALDNAKFASEEKKQAALSAFNYFWK